MIFLQKTSIIDVQIGSNNVSQKIKIVKMKVMLEKSSQLLQCMVFLFFLFWHNTRVLKKMPGKCLQIKQTIYNKISKLKKCTSWM